MLKSASLAKLERLLGMVREAEEARLAGALAKIAACRARVAQLRREIEESCIDWTSGGGHLVAANMVAASRWSIRLAELADAEEARRVILETESAAIHTRLRAQGGGGGDVGKGAKRGTQIDRA